VGFGLPSLTEDSLATHHFYVEVDGTAIGSFQEVSGLTSEVKVIEHPYNNAKGLHTVKKTPGNYVPATIKLKRGLDLNMELYKWHQKVVQQGDVPGARKSGSVVFCGYDNAEVARYNFKNAWVSKYTGGSGKAGGNEIIAEEIDIVTEQLERVK
jgi:phage tail-like protein